jgi:hypothetical protein
VRLAKITITGENREAMTKKSGLPADLAKNAKLRRLIESGEVVYHPANKAAQKRAAKGQFKTIRLKRGVRIAEASKLLH